MKRLISLFTLIIINIYWLYAVEVRGVVVDSSDNSSLPFCTLRAEPGGILISSDVDGEFSLSLPKGDYSIIVTYPGYKDKIEKIIVDTAPVKLEVSMTQNLLTLGEVVVTAKESTGMSVGSKIDRAAMSHLQPSSFTDLLELLPGNISKNPNMVSANSITLRETGTLGATGTPTTNADYSITSLGTLFVVDGAPISTDANLQTVGTTSDTSSPDYTRNITNKGVDMRTLTTDNIESVEIIRGIPSVEYGNLTSGLVNIKRRKVASPLSARFKADEWSKLFYMGKGFMIPGYDNVLNADIGYLDSKSDPRSNLENFKRLNASLRFSGNANFNSGVFKYNIGSEFTGSFDNAKVDPDLSNGKIDEYKSIYRRTALNLETTTVLSDFPYISDINFNAALSYQDDILERRKQVAPSRPSAAPTTMEAGVHDGEFIIGEYIADYRCEGKPFSAYVKANVSGRFNTGIVSHRYIAGLEWNNSKNFGEGQIYDLRYPLSASWTSRPRKFSGIPALNTLSFYVQDMISINTVAGNFDLQLGVRTNSLVGIESAYRLSGKIYPDPRLNILWHFPAVGNFKPFVGGGYGHTTKMPTVDYLYPQPHYNDFIQLNYYDLNNPREFSRLNLRTYIDDATNYDIEPARNRKYEMRIGAALGDNRFSITFFNERMSSGFRYSDIYSTYCYTSFDTSFINSATLTGPPDLASLPSQQVYVLDGYRCVSNGSKIEKTGIEYQLNTARWQPLKTSLIVTGAWFKTVYSNSQMLYSPVSEVIDGVSVSDRYVGLYNYSDGRVNEQFNTNFMFDTQLNNLGLVFTTTLQCVWFVKSTMIPKDGHPVSYLSSEDGMLHPYTSDSEADPALKSLIKTYNDNMFLPVKIAPAVYLNFKASKNIGKLLRISLFVNRIIDYLPDYKVNGLTVRRSSEAYFGMEINLNLSI